MKTKYIFLLLTTLFFSCETEVEPGLDTSINVLVIDAWLTNNDPIQHINITRSQPYFQESSPVKVTGANVTISDLTDPSIPDYVFEEQVNRYTWQSTDGSGLGSIGHDYLLTVELNGNTYTSTTTLEPVPPMDSIRFRLEEGNAFFDDLIFAEFFATDLPGINNTYWIKAWRNNQFLGKPDEINIAYDAAFSVDLDNDGKQFIQPIRDGINPLETSRTSDVLSPYLLPQVLVKESIPNSTDTLVTIKETGERFGVLRNDYILFEDPNYDFESSVVPEDLDSLFIRDNQFEKISATELLRKGDSVYVEIHSISNEAYFFLNQVILETNREGGFGALFATPLANVSTNIIPENSNTSAIGFFNMAAVSSDGIRLTSEEQVRIVE